MPVEGVTGHELADGHLGQGIVGSALGVLEHADAVLPAPPVTQPIRMPGARVLWKEPQWITLPRRSQALQTRRGGSSLRAP
jgi:hypothetical protein